MTDYYCPNPQLLDFIRVQNLVLSPITDSKFCMIGVDYKNESGTDCYTYAVVVRGPSLTDEALVKSFREDMEQKGFELSAVHEYDDGEAPRLIYVKRSFFEEVIRDLNGAVPKDLKAAMEDCGYHPINLEDFT